MERQRFGLDLVPQKTRMPTKYRPNLRFDVEGEEDTNNNSKLYGFLMQCAIDLEEGQTQNSDSED